MTRDDLADLDPGAQTYHPAALAELLTMFADDLAAEYCPCASHQLTAPRQPIPPA